MPVNSALDSATATIVAAAVGALAALVGTFITLLVTRWLDDLRWRRERRHRETVERRAAYAKMRRTMVVWREATLELVGKPTEADWDKYRAAGRDALEAGAELEMIGSPLALEAVSEALDELADVEWDYENNGPWTVESGPLWNRMAYIDARIAAFRDLARAEFELDPAVEDPRRWLETPELIHREVDELQKRREERPRKRKESAADAQARRDYEAGVHYGRRAGTVRRLVLAEGMSKRDAVQLVDAWEEEARRRRLNPMAADYWQQAEAWMAGPKPEYVVLPGEEAARTD